MPRKADHKPVGKKKRSWPLTKVTEKMRARWRQEARESIAKLDPKKMQDGGFFGAPGWCKACDRGEEHTHTFKIPE